MLSSEENAVGNLEPEEDAFTGELERLLARASARLAASAALTDADMIAAASPRRSHAMLSHVARFAK